MKLSVLLFLFTSLSFAQMRNYEMMKKDLLNDVIRQETFNNKGETFIAKKIDSVNVEHLLKLILEKPYITNPDFQSENLILTGEELEYLSKAIRQQYKNEWQEKDFNNRKLLQKSDILEYLNKDLTSQVLMISKPIYIKSDNTAFIYIASLHRHKGYGNSSLALYTNKDGIWKKSFNIIEDNY
ncbi:hypothetical protein [Flavobacterium panacagri]|uniref:hypothetical protein n=1 Tax=Flavobacterium panacagri TaxID=3034146 RepID=UPI0025A5D76C|nr:hypothetical protein [Flavobacterium panacagri]